MLSFKKHQKCYDVLHVPSVPISFIFLRLTVTGPGFLIEKELARSSL